jgi:hypothetical protein
MHGHFRGSPEETSHVKPRSGTRMGRRDVVNVSAYGYETLEGPKGPMPSRSKMMFV